MDALESMNYIGYEDASELLAKYNCELFVLICKCFMMSGGVTSEFALIKKTLLSDVLELEDFNRLTEFMPATAKYIAIYKKISIQDVRKLFINCSINTLEFMSNLIPMRNEIDDDFKKIRRTFYYE